MCNEARQKSDREPGEPAVAEAPAPLQMYKPQIRPSEVAMVGNYAIRFHWNDGHQHGIFSWDYLREWCPCDQCRTFRASTAGLEQDIKNHPPRVQ
jgi:DUF971 family protein